MEPQENPQDRLAEMANVLRSGGKPSVVTVRSFLGLFRAQRRGYLVVEKIRDALATAGLRTEPDFEAVYIDGEISFALDEGTDESRPPELGTTVVAQAWVTFSDQFDLKLLSAGFADPTHRISKLAAANRAPVTVRPDATLSEAVTSMMANDFSQVPVMPNERDVKGVVSWRSIGSRLALGQKPATAKEAMDSGSEIPADASFFAAIPLIVEHGYVLIRGTDERIVGIVTASDMSLQFQQLAEPFLIMGEIENHIRRIIGSNFDVSVLKTVRDPKDDSREVTSVADLTFGEYLRLLEEPARWDSMKLQVDRASFIKLLDRVREIRNDVMHFDPDGIPSDDLESLRDFSRFLQALQKIGAT